MPIHQQDLLGALSAVTIFGPGLIGGSLGLALQKRLPGCDLRFWTRTSSVEKTAGVFPRAYLTDNPCKAVEGASLIVFCCPVEAMEKPAREMAEAVSPEAVITDAGSVKAAVVRMMEPLFGNRFVGAHPMAGSEQSGVEHANESLYEGATCILTPTETTSEDALIQVKDFWTLVGCRTLQMSPEHHDRLVARSSHLPHALASALVNTVAETTPEALDVTGSGFRDTTRIAAGPESMWAGIFLENRKEVLAALGELHQKIDDFAELLERGDYQATEKFLLRAREVRKDLE